MVRCYSCSSVQLVSSLAGEYSPMSFLCDVLRFIPFVLFFRGLYGVSVGICALLGGSVWAGGTGCGLSGGLLYA